jgi:hypothetical protein
MKLEKKNETKTNEEECREKGTPRENPTERIGFWFDPK